MDKSHTAFYKRGRLVVIIPIIINLTETSESKSFLQISKINLLRSNIKLSERYKMVYFYFFVHKIKRSLFALASSTKIFVLFD